MAKFVFKFESVLKQRLAAEDVAQRDLAKLMRERMILHDQIRNIQQTITQSKHELADSLVGHVDLTQVSQFARYSGEVTRRARGIVFKLASLEKRIEQARHQLLEATRARKSIELLHDRQLEQWKLQQDRREETQLDEIALQAFVRGNSQWSTP